MQTSVFMQGWPGGWRGIEAYLDDSSVSGVLLVCLDWISIDRFLCENTPCTCTDWVYKSSLIPLQAMLMKMPRPSVGQRAT
jgi:hypothetical protein